MRAGGGCTAGRLSVDGGGGWGVAGEGMAVHTQLPRAEARWLCGAAALLGQHCTS